MVRKFENFTHTNCLNETIDFVSLGIFINESDIRDYVWEYTEKANKVRKFKRGIVEKSIPFRFRIKDETQANQIKDMFYEHFEKDILRESKGYFTINGYKYYCYCHGSSKSMYSRYDGILNLELKIVTDESVWVKETTKEFSVDNIENVGNSNGLNFPHNFPYNYDSSMKSSTIDNDSFVSSDFILRIYGNCTNPNITIGGKSYAVNVDVATGEQLVIDSRKKTIKKITKKGKETNVFNDRVRKKVSGNDIFDKIDSGRNTVSWNNDFSFDVVLIDMRGEPKWS